VSAEWKGEGIDPRFTLANERTFLAWNRTGLALIAGGLGVAELLRSLGDDDTRRLIGVPMIILGGVLSVCAEERQRRVQRSMEEGKGVPKSRLPLLLTLVLTVVAVAAVALTVFG
jgi:putative membrane protein